MRAHGFVLFGPRVRLPALVDATDRSYIRRLTTRATITRCRDDAALTGLGPQQIEAIVDQLRPTRPRSRGRPWAASLRRRVVVACASLRTNLTVRELAAVFAISRAQVHRILVDLVPRLGALFERTQHGDRRRTWIVDGTLVPTRDHLAAAKSKNDRWSCNLQVLARHKDLRVVAVGGAGPGNRNDTVHYRGSPIERLCTRHRRVLADGGYRGIDELVTPVFRSNRIVRDQAWRRHRARRARVEHVIARLKTWRVLRDHRRRGRHLLDTARAVAYLHNLKIELRDSP